MEFHGRTLDWCAQHGLVLATRKSLAEAIRLKVERRDRIANSREGLEPKGEAYDLGRVDGN